MARALDLTTLKLFLAVVEERSMARAAEREHITAPAISKRIADLERQLGVRLLERRAIGVKPTDAGRTLAADARGIFAALDRLQGKLSEYAMGARGEVRICASPTSISGTLPEELQAFVSRYPLVRIYLDERRSAHVVESVANGDADIGIFSSNVPAADLEVFPYRKVDLVVIAPLNHPLSKRRSIAFADTAEFDYIGLSDASSIGARVASAAAELGISIKTKMQVTTHGALCRVVQAGMGIGILPKYSAVPYSKLLNIRCLRTTDGWAYHHLSLCTRKVETLSMSARLLLAHLQSKAPSARTQPR